jgi:hypothetical protein
MGLDMYLSRHIYVRDAGRRNLKIEGLNHLVRPAKVSEIVEEVGYWRKANAVHRWFVENVQKGVDDCGDYSVSREQLQELLRQVELVLDQPDQAKDTLPTQDGFFFGSAGYLEDLRDTQRIVKEALATPHDPWTWFTYRASW